MNNYLRKILFCLITLFVIAGTAAVFHLTQKHLKNFSRGRHAFENRDYQKALRYFEAAVQLKPSDKNTLRYLVATYDKLHRDPDLLDELIKLSQVEEGDMKIKIWIADLYYKLDDFKNAEIYYHKVLERTPTLAIQKKLAEVLIWQKKYDAAVDILDALPKDPKTIELRALVYDGLGRDEDVLQQLEQLEQLKQQTPEMMVWMAALYYKFGNFEKAETIYRKALEQEQNPEVQIKLAEVMTWQKKYAPAIHILESLPEDSRTMEFLADIYSWNKDYDKAVILYKKLLSEPNSGDDVELKLADVLRAAKKDQEAVTYYQQYLQKHGKL